MDTITIAVRWCCVPQAHINFVTDGITKWYMSRWIYKHSKTKNLTIICVQVEFKRVSAYIQQLLSVMKALWVEPGRGSMDWEALDTLLDDTPLVPVSTNKYSVTHTTMRPGDSFYYHVCNTVELVKGRAWILRRELTIADKMTILKLHSKHEPHSVTLLVPGTATRMIHVRCTEPQRIYELFKKYGLTCSNVWDSRTSLSATAPCTALCDHNMTTVNVNRIAENDALGQEPEVSNFYHNMKCIRIQAKRDALKHRPYSTHHRSVVDAAQLPSASVDGTCSNETQPDCISVALYYYDRMAKLGDVIKSDGRFVPSVQYSNPEEWSGDRYVLELEPDNNVIITGCKPTTLSE
ncbi:uncharacterized protein LOC117594193 [Esox lucius]|uniref:uncharacterized protein LOC117594193 n=1 Tax=Esox lucius TaxID=8010 RepID=UPI0014770F9D|nr:uncharacterized protein LOC117594193 [Esox lucius]